MSPSIEDIFIVLIDIDDDRIEKVLKYRISARVNTVKIIYVHRKKGHSCFENIFSFNMEILK